MTARLILPMAWRRLLSATPRHLDRERLRPETRATPQTPWAKDDDAATRRLLAAVPPLLMWRP